MMTMSFFTEALTSFYVKIKEKPLIQTPIPMLTKIIHNTSCTGVHSVKTTVQSMVMSVFVQVDPWICMSIVGGTAVGQLVSNWTDPKIDAHLGISKIMPNDTDLNIDMDIFENKGRFSPLGQENTTITLPEGSPKVVGQSFINSSAKIPFTRITLPDFHPTPSKSLPFLKTPLEDYQPEIHEGKESKPIDSSLPLKTKPIGTSPPKKSSPTECTPSANSKPVDIKSPIRYKKPIYGSMDSHVFLTKPTGPNRELRAGSNPANILGDSGSLSKGPDEKLLLCNMLTPKTLSSTETEKYQQGNRVGVFIRETRVHRYGSNPDLRRAPTTQATISNPALHIGPSSNLRAVSNPDVRTGSSLRMGSVQSLQPSPSSLITGPSQRLRTGPRSTLSVGSNPSLRTGPNKIRRSKLHTSPLNSRSLNHAFEGGGKTSSFLEIKVSDTEEKEPYAAVK